MPPKKEKEQPSVEKLLLNKIPRPPEPESFFSIEQPLPFDFPLDFAKVEGVQLIECYFPEEINRKIEDSIHTHIERIGRYNDKLCVMGRGRGLLIGQRSLECPGISAFAYGSGFLVTASEDCTLAVYSSDLKPMKQFKEFSPQKITFLKIVRPPREFQGLVVIYSTGRDLVFCRMEKSFFSGLTVKAKKEILVKLMNPITQIIEAPLVLRPHLMKDVSYMDTELVAVVTVNLIYVVRFQTSRLTFERPWDIVYERKFEQEATTSANWGQANIKSATKEIYGERVVLTYSHGNKFFMTALQQINQYLDTDVKQKLEWIDSKPLLLDEKANIAFCQCMKKNEILIVTDKNELVVFHTVGVDLFDQEIKLENINSIGCVFPEQLKGNTIEVLRKSLAFVAPQQLPELLEDQRRQLVPIVTYGSSFSYEYGSNEIYFLTDRQFGIYVYKNWKQICDYLKIQQKFEAAMLFLIALYHKENRFDLGLQQTEAEFNGEVSEYAQILAVEYIKTKLSSLSHMPELLGRVNLDTVLMTPIDFMVRINEFVFLFEILREKIIGYKSEDDFYRVLQPFIYHGRIKFIPEGQLRPTFDYYIDKGRLDIIERLAIYFNLALIDRSLVMQYLLNQKLVVSLAFICTQGNQNEFVTPFVKFWGLSENEKRMRNMHEAKEYALRALWYVKLCLQRNMALKEYSFEKYAHMIEILVANFFTRRMIKSLVEISCEACLDTLACAFSIEISGIVNDSQKFKLPEVRIHKWIKQREGNTNIELMLSGIYDFCREVGMDSDANELFYLMLSRIMIYKTVAFTREKYLDILTFLTINYKSIRRIKYGLDIEKVKNIEELCSQEEADEILSSEYLSKLLILGLQEEPDLKDDFSRLFDTSRQVPLTELQAYISLLAKNYKASIEIYLRGRETSKKGIFAFLENSFKSFQLSKKKAEVQAFASALSQYVSALIHLDAKLSRNLIQTYMPEQQEQLIFALGADERLQLDYLKSIIHESYLSEKAMLLYVTLMCKYEQENLAEAFRTYQHLPIEQSLKICEKYQSFDCMEYIYERMGNVEKSVEIACSRIDKAFQQRFMYEDAHVAYKIIDDILTNAIQTCVKNHTESIWESLLDAAIDLFNKYRQRPQYADEMFVFYQINAKILYYMVNHSSVDYVIRLFQTKYTKLDMGGSMRQAFIEILSNYSYSENILFSAHELTKDIYMDELVRQKNEWLHAFKPDRFCNNCEFPVARTEEAIAFCCGHIYHKNCVVDANPKSGPDASPIFYCTACLSKPNEQLSFYLSIPNPQNPKVKIDKLFAEADKRKLEMKETFKVQDFEQSQRDKQQEHHQQNFMSKQDRFKKYDMLYEASQSKNRLIQAELEEKFDKFKVR